MSIIIDSREPEDYRLLGDEVATMDCDAIVVGSEKKYAVERKEVADLWKSLYDGRLFEQLSALSRAREEGFIPILVVQGDLGRYVKLTGKTKPQLLGLFIAIASFGVPVIFIKSYDDYALLLGMLREKAGKKSEQRVPLQFKKKELTIEDERKMMLMAVRGIGQKKAEELLSRFTSIRRLVEQLEEAKEILGEKLFNHLKEVIG